MQCSVSIAELVAQYWIASPFTDSRGHRDQPAGAQLLGKPGIPPSPHLTSELVLVLTLLGFISHSTV